MTKSPGGLTDLSGKTALVTGASGGIGQAIAVAFATAGASVAFHHFENREPAEKLVNELKQNKADVECFCADLTEPDDIEVLFDSIVGRFGSLDILVNNAAVYPTEDIFSLTKDKWNALMNADMTSVHLCTRAAASIMKDKNSGCIINISSIEGENPQIDHSYYSAAKGGINAYTKACALELGQYGIRVNAVSPGLIYRDNLEKDWPQGVNRYLKTAPLGRLGSPDDVARGCLFLASGWASWITGINLRIDGGLSAVPGY